MDEEYRPIFEEIYLRYARYGPLFPLPPEEAYGRLRSQIESATEREGLVGRIRADAKVFLLINLYEMFILPVALRGIPGRRHSIDEVWGNLSADLVTILRQAAIDSRNEPEVTARHILSAVNAVYRDLKLPSFNVWG